MATRKRKSPERRKPAKGPGLFSRLAAGAAGAVAATAARHPRAVGGAAVFAVVFSFVAANALWYQPGGHPAPWLATRDLTDPNAIAGYRPVLRAAPEEVTTFRIERAGDAAPAESAARGPANADVVPVAAPQPSAPEAPSADRQILAEVQRELSRQGLYDGADDGLMGPRTAAAILSFQELAGVPPTGAATPELLAALKARPAGRPQERTVAAPPAASPAAVVREAAPPVPAMRPAENVNAGQDPVAAAIRAAEKSPSMRPPGEIPVSARSVSAPKSPVLPTSDLVLQIQRGLSNIAYADVTVDGVAGEQTRAAIRRFEKHYRLPETGEPNEQVLRKLKSIGAL